MEANLRQIEPTENDCEECSESPPKNYHNAKIHKSKSDLVLCLGCLLDKNLDEESSQELEDAIRLDVTEGNIKYHSTGYSSRGVFGEYRVDFDVDRNAEVQKQVSVDEFKKVCSFTRLTGEGDIILENPNYGRTGFSTDTYRRDINEDKKQKAIDEHQRRI